MKALLISVLISLVGSIVTKDNIRELLNVIFNFLAEQANNTETTLDNDSLEVVETLLNEEELVNLVDKFVKAKLIEKKV